LILAAALAAAASPAAARGLELFPTSGVEMSLAEGVPIATSDQVRSVVVLVPVPERLARRVSIRILMRNRGMPVAFSPANVTATAEGTPLKPIGQQQLVREQKSRQFWSDVGETVGEAMNSSRATSTVYASGSIGGRRYSSSLTYRSPVMEAITDQQNADSEAALAARHSLDRAQLAMGEMPAGEVPQNGEASGILTFELPPALMHKKGQFGVTIAVDVGGTIHRFELAAYKD
jgi:hypothetical protein